MNVTLGGLSVSMPDGWHDRSTLTFVMPDDEGLRDPRALQKQSSHNAANISMSLSEASEDVTPEVVLQAQVGQLPQALPGFSLEEQGETEEGWPFALLRFEVGIVVRQWLCVRPIDDRLVLLTASASDPLFPDVRAKGEATLRSLKA